MNDKSIQAKVAKLCKIYGIPGLAYAVVCKGSIEKLGCFGFASIPFNVPVTTKTLFHIGSVGKHMTSAALLRLAAEGLIDVDAPIVDYVQHVPKLWSDRTIRCLLNHTSGLPNYTDFIVDDRKMSNKDVYAAIAAESPGFAAGESFDYSNTNYRLIGDVIEVVCKQSYARHMATEIFALAGLEETVIDSCDSIFENHAEPYTLTDRGVERAAKFYMINLGSADGGIAMSASDAAKWDIALWDGSILSGDSLRLMVEPVTLNSGHQFPYAAGWFVDEVGGYSRVWHGGTMPGFKAHYLHTLKENLSVFVMSNLPQPIAAEKHIAETIAEHVRPGSTPCSLSPIDDDDSDRTKLAHSIVFRTSDSLPRESLIDELRIPLSIASSGVNLLDLSAIGLPETFELVEQKGSDKSRIRRYRARWGDRIEHITVSHQANGLIERVARC